MSERIDMTVGYDRIIGAAKDIAKQRGKFGMDPRDRWEDPVLGLEMMTEMKYSRIREALKIHRNRSLGNHERSYLKDSIVDMINYLAILGVAVGLADE